MAVLLPIVFCVAVAPHRCVTLCAVVTCVSLLTATSWLVEASKSFERLTAEWSPALQSGCPTLTVLQDRLLDPPEGNDTLNESAYRASWPGSRFRPRRLGTRLAASG